MVRRAVSRAGSRAEPTPQNGGPASRLSALTGGGPGTSTEMPSVLAYKMTFEFWNLGEASALAVIVWLLFFAFCNVFYQLAKRKLNAF